MTNTFVFPYTLKTFTFFILNIIICTFGNSQVSFQTHNFTNTEIITPSIRSIKLVDIDNDGDLDVIAAAAGDTKVTWTQNNGSGSFGSQNIIPAGTISGNMNGQDILPLDVDNDGDFDIVTNFNNILTWNENIDGLGNFGPQQLIIGNLSYIEAIFAADIDNDGKEDLLVTQNDDKIIWLQNLSAVGAFSDPLVITTTTDSPHSVIAADVDNDGDLDVFSASWNDDKIAWYENLDGQGGFGSQQIISSSVDGAFSIYASDIDGDNDLDVIASASAGDKVYLFKNEDGEGDFGNQNIITMATDYPMFSFTFDVDSDGDEDVISSSGLDDKLAWYENTDGLGNFGGQEIINIYNVSAMATVVSHGDIDGDGDIDLIAAYSNNEVLWYENLGVVLPETPTAICFDIEVNLDDEGVAFIEVIDIDNGSTDNIEIIDYSISQNSFDCSDIGDIEVTLTVIDEDLNSDTCIAIISVMDTQLPEFSLVSLPSVYAECMIDSLTPPTAQDNCSGNIIGLPNIIFPITASTSVVWNYTDDYGNSSVQEQQVIISDTTAPEVNILILDDSISDCQIFNLPIPTAFDNCAGVISGTNTIDFPLNHEDSIFVTWTFDDGSGNLTTQEQFVQVKDTIPPTVITTDITIDLAGNASINIVEEQIDNGSFDNCNVQQVYLDFNTFSEVGSFPVVLYVEDVNNNIATGTATVTITNNTVQVLNPSEITNLTITPNPISDEFEVIAENELIRLIRIYGVTGLLKEYKNPVTEKFNISTFPSGVYYIEITTDNGKRGLKKMIKI